MATPRFFNPFAEIDQHRNHLPHWQQPGATYFITFHLADSVPSKLRADWVAERAAWLEHHPEPWTPEIEQEYHQRFSARIDRWLMQATVRAGCAPQRCAPPSLRRCDTAITTATCCIRGS